MNDKIIIKFKKLIFMELGWIDFSKTERDKVFNVLDLLGEQGVLDELGIATIRDGFSDILFPGTSTIQTRAKYFLIVPYALKDLEFNKDIKINNLNKTLDSKEAECSKILNSKHSESGIIGRNAILLDSWVQRPPSNIYLAGLKRYGIFNFKSINHYLKFISSQKQEKLNNHDLGYINEADEGVQDDEHSPVNHFSQLLNIPTYNKGWMEDLDINLTNDESQFLKNQIITNCKGSMLSYILENNMSEIVDLDSITDLSVIIDKFPEQIQRDYHIAMEFSEFIFVLRVVYNLIVSNWENKKAINYYNSFEDNLDFISNINITQIMMRLNINNRNLKNFLETSKKLMKKGDIEGLSSCIKNREIQLKGINRARLAHVGEFNKNEWFAGERLNYRFGNVKIILEDIFNSLGDD